MIYNSDGREIGVTDSQPTKFAARELARSGTLVLDRTVAETPPFGERSAFQRDLQGHYRSAYSIVPALEGGALGWMLGATRLLDLSAPLAPNWIAALTASLLVAGAVTLVFVALTRLMAVGAAALAAVGLGLGTNLWPVASRTLWAHETVMFGLALAVFAWLRPVDQLSRPRLLLGAIGLALAGSAWPQVTPTVAVLLVGLIARVGFRRALPAVATVCAAAIAVALFQWQWFGDPLGAMTRIEGLHPIVHGVAGPLSATPWTGAAGLLLSPNRGLLIFSPIVLIALIGLPAALRDRGTYGSAWFAGAALAQFVAYSWYAVWWGGHTFGPRYAMDVLVPLMPAVPPGLRWIAARSWRRGLAWIGLAWSIGVAATGAFCYPNDRWNVDPVDVDLHHERLWEWHDLQIVRCWRRGMSPQNFGLLE